MQKLLLSLLFISLCASGALAQSSDDYNKVEFYGGYSRASVQPNIEASTAFVTTFEQCSANATDILGKNFQTSFCHRRGFNGFDHVRVHKRIDIRLVELDYNPIFTREFDVAGNPFSVIHATPRTANNFTIGFGIAFH